MIREAIFSISGRMCDASSTVCAPGERLDEIAHGDDLMRIEPAGRLVQHQDLGIAEQSLRDRHALAEATGQLAGRELHHARQVEPLGGIVHRTSRRSAAQSLDAGHEVQEFDNRM